MLENLFHPVTMQNPERKERFEKYYYKHRCTFDVTSDIDATPLMNYCYVTGKDFFITLLYTVSKVVNENVTYKYDVSPYMGLGYWETVHPEYTVYNEEKQLFMHVCTQYNENFDEFYAAAKADIEECKTGGHIANENMPANRFFTTYLPWRHFTGVALNTEDDYKCLLPTLIIGKCKCENSKYLLPVSAKFHRAACDGKATADFFNKLEDSLSKLTQNAEQ